MASTAPRPGCSGRIECSSGPFVLGIWVRDADYKAKATADFKKRNAQSLSRGSKEYDFRICLHPWTWDSSDQKNKLEDFVAARQSGLFMERSPLH